ncbi:PQQ-binding-like beta-propeller repeat protein [Actinoplanes sp. G11-F43]|uniref:outer membrane protein assembly factor BamB family protein n=1 Tax=Actinoplanes sp. G11-F43 TaxID=3424130 RepID=UPI003D34A15C
MLKAGVIATIAVLGAASWGHDGYGPGNTRYNPAETGVNASTVDRLQPRWTVRPAAARPGCEPAPAGPRAVGDRVYLLDGGGVAAYAAGTGRRLWHHAGTGLITAGPIVAGGLVLVASTACESASSYDSALIALDAATGAQRWRRTAAWTADTAIADAGVIVTSGECGTCDDARHAVTAHQLDDGTPLWTHHNEVLAGPVSAAGTVLLRRTTGKAETWAGRITTGTPVWGTGTRVTAVAANPDGTHLYLTGDGGLSARSATDGSRLWRIPKEAGDLAADGRRVYVASAGRVNTYDAGTGRLAWTRALTTPRDPVRAGGLLYVLTGKGALTVLTPAGGKVVRLRNTYTGLRTHVVPAGGRLLTTRGAEVRAYAP